MGNWRLADNLQDRVDAMHSCYPQMVIGEVGDPKHLTEQSDHNPDAYGIVHAVDFMTYGNEEQAHAIIDWCLSAPADLQYVIHDREIWDVDAGWKSEPYTGSNPHTDHVHVSGRHGGAGATAYTGVGYSMAAENIRPSGSPCTKGTTMTNPQPPALSETNKLDIAWRIEAIANMRDVFGGGTYKGQPVPLVAALKDIQASLAKLADEPAPSGTLAVTGTLTLSEPAAS